MGKKQQLKEEQELKWRSLNIHNLLNGYMVLDQLGAAGGAPLLRQGERN